MSIVCGSLTEEDNPLSLCTYLIPNLNFFSILKLWFFRNKFKIFLFIPILVIRTINIITNNLFDFPSGYFITIDKRSFCLFF